MSNKFDIAIPHATLGLAFAVVIFLLPHFLAPSWLIIGILIWLTFSLIALLYTADTAHREFITGTLRHRKFTQIYTLPAKKCLKLVLDPLLR